MFSPHSESRIYDDSQRRGLISGVLLRREYPSFGQDNEYGWIENFSSATFAAEGHDGAIPNSATAGW
jgi:hypothetical protein